MWYVQHKLILHGEMFLGKWNSDNSYYLYEQIKALFYEATGAAVFIREGWSAVPAAARPSPGCRCKPRNPCWGRGDRHTLSLAGLPAAEPEAFLGRRCPGAARSEVRDCSAPPDAPASSARSGKRSQGLPSALLQKLGGLRDAPAQTQSFTAAMENPSSAKLLFQSFALTVVVLIQPLRPVVAVAPYTLSIFWHKTSLSLNSEESQGSATKQHLKNYTDLYNVPNTTENEFK